MATAMPPPIKTPFKILVPEKEMIRKKQNQEIVNINFYPFGHAGRHQKEKPSLSR